MSRIVDYSDGSAITREACAWIAQLDGDQPLSTADLAALREWVNRSPAHRLELERLVQLWGGLNVLTELAGATAPQRPAAGKNGRRLREWFPVRAGLTFACAALLAVAAILLTRIGDDGRAADVAYHTEVGEQLREALPDGSTLTLNTDSSIRLAFSEKERAVWLLRGEAHFDVAHDRRRPFIVRAGTGLVRAVGTAFSVRLEDNEIEVTVAEGTVELASATAGRPEDGSAVQSQGGVTAPRQLAVLEAGHTASFSDRIDSLVTVPEDELVRRLSWKQGMLVFSGDRLDTVVAEVSRYTTRTIEFSDPTVRELRIGGQFRVGEIDALFEALQMSFGVDVRRDGERIVLSRASGKKAN